MKRSSAGKNFDNAIPKLDRVIVWLIAVVSVGPAQATDLTAENDYLGPEYTRPDGRRVNAAAEYWTDVIGVAFDRDVELVIPQMPLDLDFDGKPDLLYQGRWSLPGGILANPQKVGLVPTPDDPAGTVGQHSISTGFLGVRQEKDPLTQTGTGRYGFNCWVCHGSADATGRIVLGRPNSNIDLGLIAATARALDPKHILTGQDGQPLTSGALSTQERISPALDFDLNKDGAVSVREWRQVMRFPDAQRARALLMLAGPGRLDQSIDLRLGDSIPATRYRNYIYAKHGQAGYQQYLRSNKQHVVFNPVSIPTNLPGLGIAHYSWSGKDSSFRMDSAAILKSNNKLSTEQLLSFLDFALIGDAVDHELLNRVLTLDFRNISTVGLETDTPNAVSWAHNVLTSSAIGVLREQHREFGAVRLRKTLLRQRQMDAVDDAELVARGRDVFCNQIIGRVINQRVMFGRSAKVPREYKGIAVLAPIDRSRPLDALVEVRCATCHNYSPLLNPVSLSNPIPTFQRCDVCHYDHPTDTGFTSLSAYRRTNDLAKVEQCLDCHDTHPDFGVQSYSNSWLLPFDANGNGQTHGDELADARAGGIGTDAMLNLETLFSEQLKPPAQRTTRLYIVTEDPKALPQTLRFSGQGYGWVRVAPLTMISETAPYLHNGSVPSLEDLLKPAHDRSRVFMTGQVNQRYRLQTALPGNRNCGHEFGTALSDHDKEALLAFLHSIQ